MEVKEYIDTNGVNHFSEFVKSVKDKALRRKINTRIIYLGLGNFGTHRNLSGGIGEVKIVTVKVHEYILGAMATLLSFFFWAITKEKRRIKIKILKKLRNYGRNILIERGTRMTKIMLEDSEKRIIEELKDPKEAALFLNELLSVSDANPEIRYKAFLKGLSLVMKAYGISKLAKSTGLNRTNLYQSIVSEKNTKLDKVFKILDELDLNIEITSKPRKQAESIRS